MSRRALIAHTLLTGSLLASSKSVAQTPVAIRPIALDGGIEVRDYRIFPTPDVTRFLVEIHNTSDTPVDTPEIGVILDHLADGEDFSFAVPSTEVLHPHSSDVLVGIAPSSLVDDADWGAPKWFLCGELLTEKAERTKELDLSLTYVLNPLSDGNLNIVAEVFNHGDERTREFSVGGGVFDRLRRPCGVLPTLMPWFAQPQQTERYPMDIWTGRDYIGNPYAFDVKAEDLTIEMSLQPIPQYQAPSCSPVLPWNR